METMFRILIKIKVLIVALYLFFWIKVFLTQTSNYTMPDIFQNSNNWKGASKNIKDYCRLDWDNLPIQDVDVYSNISMEEAHKHNSHVSRGGKWSPGTCVSFQTVAVIIPYRNRHNHLTKLLKRLHSLLKIQKIEYQIFVVEQVGNAPVNRGMLRNIGAKESLNMDKFDCFIFHDVDLIPEHDRNIYLCDTNLRQFSSAIDELRYHVMFENNAGGVVGLSKDNFYKINGYPNIYWGWGNEDDDLSARAMTMDIKISRPPNHIGRYKMVRHLKDHRSVSGYELFRGFRGRQFLDGINSLKSLNNYTIVSITSHPLYTNISVLLDLPDILIPSHWPRTQESLMWTLKFYGWWF